MSGSSHGDGSHGVGLRGVGLHGVGLGLRRAYAKELLARPPEGLAFLEVHPENYLTRGGIYRRVLDEARERFPIATHGLTYGVGAVRPYGRARLSALAAFVRELGSPMHSDHLCFAGLDGVFAHDLLPLPRNAETVATCVARIAELSDALGQAVAIEPISFYFDPVGSVLSEREFVSAVIAESGAGLLLDVNNVFVNSQNYGFDAEAFIAALPLERVVSLHIAGHDRDASGLCIDSHAAPICEGVYALYRYTLQKLGRHVPVLLERDDNFPHFDALRAEVAELTRIYDEVQRENAAGVTR